MPGGRDSIKIRSKPMFLRWPRRRKEVGARGFTDGGRRPFVSPAGPFLPSFSLSAAVASEKERRRKKEESSGKNDGPLATVVRDQVSLLPTTSVGDVTLTRWTRDPVSVSLCGSSRSLFFLSFFFFLLCVLSTPHVNWRRRRGLPFGEMSRL